MSLPQPTPEVHLVGTQVDDLLTVLKATAALGYPEGDKAKACLANLENAIASAKVRDATMAAGGIPTFPRRWP